METLKKILYAKRYRESSTAHLSIITQKSTFECDHYVTVMTSNSLQNCCVLALLLPQWRNVAHSYCVQSCPIVVQDYSI